MRFAGLPKPTIGDAFRALGSSALSQFTGTAIYVDPDKMVIRSLDNLMGMFIHELARNFGISDPQMAVTLGSQADYKDIGSVHK